MELQQDVFAGTYDFKSCCVWQALPVPACLMNSLLI
jgi:hypothetical protein